MLQMEGVNDEEREVCHFKVLPDASDLTESTK